MMNLFARILSHAFGLIVVALLVIGLIYRGKLFPEWELPDFLSLDTAPEQAGEAASGDVKRAGEPAAPVEPSGITDVQQPAAPAEIVTGEPGVPPADTVAAEDATADETMPAAVESVPEMVEPEPEMTGEIAEAPDQAPADGDTAVEPVPAPAEAAPVIVQEGAEPVADTAREAPSAPETAPAMDATRADEVPAPAAPAAAAATSYRVLAAAREAYWLRDYGLAEQKYQDLIALEPDNPDGYGELGNMYFSRGNWEQASAAYYEAGVRLVDQGLVREARQLVEVIRGLNGGQADALAEKVKSAGQ